MLSTTLLEKLNRQVTLEAEASSIYLQMSAWLLSQSLDNTARFFRHHAEEERHHMLRLFDYINETGATAHIAAIPEPDTDYDTLISLMECACREEERLTTHINELVNAALEEKDFSTFQFLQWYVAEQHEEEHLFSSLLHKARIINTLDGRALFRFDEEVRKSGLHIPRHHHEHEGRDSHDPHRHHPCNEHHTEHHAS
ncbi:MULTISPECIES: ferritin [Prosthecochloris]|uniref:Ferritin n=1 Tax=Prosthecochloris vibrioformis TaxID=1098 RepID=A0A5C4S379_PROVB|nr:MULTISPECIES: ferritin [Prosthecochloris]ANT64379.1 putative ferritin-1 [Prosthecochloris sp. CIB 2401]TNJ37231.1 ferritin [Prosthecochloris vibrioformis]